MSDTNGSVRKRQTSTVLISAYERVVGNSDDGTEQTGTSGQVTPVPLSLSPPPAGIQGDGVVIYQTVLTTTIVEICTKCAGGYDTMIVTKTVDVSVCNGTTITAEPSMTTSTDDMINDQTVLTTTIVEVCTKCLGGYDSRIVTKTVDISVNNGTTVTVQPSMTLSTANTICETCGSSGTATDRIADLPVQTVSMTMQSVLPSQAMPSVQQVVVQTSVSGRSWDDGKIVTILVGIALVGVLIWG